MGSDEELVPTRQRLRYRVGDDRFSIGEAFWLCLTEPYLVLVDAQFKKTG